MPKTNKVENMKRYNAIRAIETWQRAGAYSVRVQGMNRQHNISLQEEFDEHDGPDTKYIVITDKGFPIATARMYPLEGSSMMIGRVVVLPEYRHLGIGTALLKHSIRTARMNNCKVMRLSIVEENRVLRKWYELNGAVHTGTEKYDFFPFTCGYMMIDLEKTDPEVITE